MYSVIKHLRWETYDLVETLHQTKTVASLMTATDLVMSTVRLGAVTWKLEDGKAVPDMESPRKQEFHHLLQRGDFITEQFLPLIKPATQGCAMARYFDKVQVTLHYRPGCCDIGLPKQAFPLLKRPLVQVLLRLAQVGYLNNEGHQAQREDVLRLVLFWLIAVTDASKASRLAYDVIKEKFGSNVMLGRAMHDRLVEEQAAVRLPGPDEIKAEPGLAFSSGDTNRLRGESRFYARKHGEEGDSWIHSFYQKHWWRPWTYQHPILLWLQREMVAEKLDPGADPMAGKDEDTPYDYDHILPYAHWGSWTGAKEGDRLLDFADQKDRKISVVGNAIGNVRVWASSLNRADSDKSPADKLKLDMDDTERRMLLKDSAIHTDQIELWKKVSANIGEHRIWSSARAVAFQRAVEERTFRLYQRYFDELGFAEWHPSEEA